MCQYHGMAEIKIGLEKTAFERGASLFDVRGQLPPYLSHDLSASSLI
jgi:hypothetical protein